MKYFFVLGINPTLSVAEVLATLSLKSPRLLAKDFLIGDSDQDINVSKLIARLGGVIKMGLIQSQFSVNDLNEAKDKIFSLAEDKQSGLTSKFNFGFSDYGSSVLDKKALGYGLKKFFKNKSVSARLVISREKNLSSVVVASNKLLSSGLEIVVASNGQEVFIGETLAVQAFKDLSRRDYGRPARDDLSGMLPPKLAQIMINLAQLDNKQALLVDPFCGSGTVLSEASLAGFRNLIGSDISFKAISDTKKNISWLRDLYNIDNLNLKLAVKNVLNLSKFVKKNSVDAIVTEPFLGPQRGHFSLEQISQELEKIYSGALEEFYKVLRDGGRVVMVWPVFYGHKPINPSFSGFEMLDMIPDNLKSSQYLKKNIRPTIIYGRPGQKVYREIVVLQKKRL